MDNRCLGQFYLQDLPPDLADTLSRGPPQFDLFESSMIDTEDLTNWSTKHPDEWSSEDIIDWIYSIAEDPLDLKLNTVCGESFQDVDGRQLCLFTAEEFQRRDRINGLQLYNCLQELLRQSHFIPPSDLLDLDDSFEDIKTLYRCDSLCRIDLDRMESPESVQQIPGISFFLDPLNKFPFEDPCASPFEENFSSPIPAFLSSCSVDDDVKASAMQDSGYESAASSYSDNSTPSSACPSPKNEIPNLFPSSTQKLDNTSDQTSPYRSKLGQLKATGHPGQIQANSTPGPEGRPPKRKPGRPPKRTLSLLSSSSSSSSSSNDDSCSSTTSKKSKKNVHLWKFMRSLLEDPAYNPNSIKWENKTEGVFRIVPGQSKFIAKLWGQRKNNPSMTFDKMSRSLRWCRTYGFLSEVPKNGNYPKKLCFRFGDRASDWRI